MKTVGRLSQIQLRLAKDELRRYGCASPFGDGDLRFVPSLYIIALMQIRIGKEIMRQPILGIGKYCLLESRSGYGIVALFQDPLCQEGLAPARRAHCALVDVFR